MKILITGASGFLGKSLCKILESDDNEIVKLNSINCDLTLDNSLNNFNEIQYDLIFHLAAWTQAGDFCLRHPGEQWIINQKINTNLLSWWQESQSQAKLIFMGTSCSYSCDLKVLSEENYLEGLPIESLYTYGMTKRMLLVGAQSLKKQYDMEYLCFVPSTLYGPSYHTDGRQMHFIFDLIRKIIRGSKLGDDVILWGNGYQKRELVYVDDFVNIMLDLVKTQKNELINIGAGEEYTIREFAEKICQIIGFDHNKIIYDESKHTGAKSKFLDVTKAKSLTKDYQIRSLDDGLQNTVKWFVDEFDNGNFS